MEDENLENFLRDVISENKPVDDTTEQSGKDAARVLYAYYTGFMLYGFPEERAFQLTLFILSKILEGQNGGKKQ